MFATPIPLEISVREARDIYLRDNGFTIEGYTAPHVDFPVGPWTLRLPNPPARHRAVAAHDLHHVLTGYGTDYVGECEVSAWEVRAGMGGQWIAWFLCTTGFVTGLVFRPGRTWEAWKKARSATSLLGASPCPEDVLDLSVAEARSRLGIPEDGVASEPARLTRDAPGNASA